MECVKQQPFARFKVSVLSSLEEKDKEARISLKQWRHK